MKTLKLKKVFFVSCIGHIGTFALMASFGFSLGSVPGHTVFTPVIFCGSIFPQSFTPAVAIRPFAVITKTEPSLVGRPLIAVSVPFDYCVKPATAISYELNKAIVVSQALFAQAPKRKDPVLLMHPLLPYQFDLYFKDRQTVHIELEFEITRANDRNFVSLHRKISSGNLEADLLSMRYIGHYLFIQQARFMANIWQTVKIEFSPNTR